MFTAKTMHLMTRWLPAYHIFLHSTWVKVAYTIPCSPWWSLLQCRQHLYRARPPCDVAPGTWCALWHQQTPNLKCIQGRFCSVHLVVADHLLELRWGHNCFLLDWVSRTAAIVCSEMFGKLCFRNRLQLPGMLSVSEQFAAKDWPCGWPHCMPAPRLMLGIQCAALSSWFLSSPRHHWSPSLLWLLYPQAYLLKVAEQPASQHRARHLLTMSHRGENWTDVSLREGRLLVCGWWRTCWRVSGTDAWVCMLAVCKPTSADLCGGQPVFQEVPWILKCEKRHPTLLTTTTLAVTYNAVNSDFLLQSEIELVWNKLLAP